MERIIFHCDANNFFASVEEKENPALLGKAVAVAGDPKKRTGIVLAKNMLAKSFGVKTGDAIWEAKQKCPHLVFVPPHFERYQCYSQKLVEIYQRYTDRIEPMGIDECWLDLTTSLHLFGKNGKEVADRIREEVKAELGITVSVGVSFGKLFAKMGSDLKKPDATTVLTTENFKEKIYDLPVRDAFGIGRQTAKALSSMGILTIGEFVCLDENLVRSRFGKPLAELQQKLLGSDTEPVQYWETVHIPKSVGNGTTTPTDMHTRDDFKATLHQLCESVSMRMIQKKMVGKTVHVSVRRGDTLIWFGRQRDMGQFTNLPSVFLEHAMQLLAEFWHFDAPARSVRIAVSTLKNEKDPVQLDLFTYNNKQQQKLQILNEWKAKREKKWV